MILFNTMKVFAIKPTLKIIQTKQKGQIFSVLVPALAIIAMSLYLLFNTAQVLRSKMSLQNTADASTYSAALVYARALNFTAYTNRAMAANEAGIATVASLHTTFGMLINFLANQQVGYIYVSMLGHEESVLNGHPIPAAKRWGDVYLNTRIADGINATQGANDLLFKAGEDFLRILNYAIAISQQTAYAASLLEIPIVAKDIIRLNDPSAVPSGDNEKIFGAQLAAFLLQCSVFTHAYWDSDTGIDFGPTNFAGNLMDKVSNTPPRGFVTGRNLERHNEAMRFAHVATESRDLFTIQRQIMPPDLSFGSRYLPDTLKALIPYDWAGATELVSEDKDGNVGSGRIRWQSADRMNVKVPTNTILGDNFAGAYYDAAVNHSEEKETANNLSMANEIEGIFTQGISTASQGGPSSEESWKGNLLKMPGAIEEPRSYGGINDANGTLLDSIKKSTLVSDGYFGPRPGGNASNEDSTAFNLIDKLYTDTLTHGFRSAGFYRSINSLQIQQSGTELRDNNNINALAIYIKSYLEGKPLKSSWNHGPNRSIGYFTSEWPMPFFRDVTSHTQTVAFEQDEALEEAISSFKITDPIGSTVKIYNLSDRGPSFAMLLKKNKDSLGLNQKDIKISGKDPIDSKFQKDQIAVLSSAGVYFRRPQDHWTRTDDPKASKGAFSYGFTGGYIEHKNLFSPYWHVRNQQPQASTRLAMLMESLIK